MEVAHLWALSVQDCRLALFLKIFREWLAKLAFWRKRPVATAEPSTVEADARPCAPVDETKPSAEAPVTTTGLMARLKLFFGRRHTSEAVADGEVEAGAAKIKRRSSDVADEPEIREPKASLFARLKQYLHLRRKPVETLAGLESNDVATNPRAEKSHATGDSEVAETPEPKLSLFARLKNRFRLGRQPAASEIELNENDKTLVIDPAKLKSEATATTDESEASPPGRLKRLLLRLKKKWLWIPAISLAAVGIISWGVVVMLKTTQEKERLQTELTAAKKMLEKKIAATVTPIQAMPAKSDPAKFDPGKFDPNKLDPNKPEKKVDPAFQIIGHAPVLETTDALSIDAGDCVVKDKKSVAENLKNCITGFNQAMVSASKKTKNP